MKLLDTSRVVSRSVRFALPCWREVHHQVAAAASKARRMIPGFMPAFYAGKQRVALRITVEYGRFSLGKILGNLLCKFCVSFKLYF